MSILVDKHLFTFDITNSYYNINLNKDQHMYLYSLQKHFNKDQHSLQKHF